MFTGKVAPIRETEKHLRGVPFAQEFALAVTMYEEKDFAMIDVIHPKVTKGATLAEWEVCVALGQRKSWPLVITTMTWKCLSFAGTPVVMENSVAELKSRGWHVTASNDNDGVAAAIERFALKETPECA